MARKRCGCEKIVRNAPRTGIPLPPGNLLDGLATHRSNTGNHLAKHRAKIIPSPNVLDDLHRDRVNLTRNLIQERQQAFTGRKNFRPCRGPCR